MSFGAIKYLIECGVTGGGVSVAPCIDDGAGAHYAPSMVQAYVLEVSSQYAIEAALDPVDPTIFAAWFAFTFVATISFYFIVVGVGWVLALLKPPRMKL